VSDPKHEDEAARKARNGRNIAFFIGLLAFVILVFIVTITRVGGNVATHGF
jgi:t-SNARE complex subunit (syntaxin)